MRNNAYLLMSILLIIFLSTISFVSGDEEFTCVLNEDVTRTYPDTPEGHSDCECNKNCRKEGNTQMQACGNACGNVGIGGCSCAPKWNDWKYQCIVSRCTAVKDAEEKATAEEVFEEVRPKLVPKKFGESFGKLTFSKGQSQMLRDQKVIKASDGYSSYDLIYGDIIHTEKDASVEITTDDGAVRLGADTTLKFIGLKFDPVSNRRITSSPDARYTPDPGSFEYKIDDKAFWDNLWKDIVDFHKENPPKNIPSCFSGSVSCLYETAQFIEKGVAWFDKKIKKDFPTDIVITPTTAITTRGTEFSVEVADDGTTKVTTLDGIVIVTDLANRKSVIVNANNQITVPKTGLGDITTIDSNSINEWWTEGVFAENEVVSINYAQGKIQQPDGNWKRMNSKTKIKKGDVIKTGSENLISLNLGGDSWTRIGPKSIFEIEDRTTFLLKEGKLYVYIWNRMDLTFKTPTTTYALEDTEFILDFDEDTNTSTLYLYQGKVEQTTLTGESIEMNGGHIVVTKKDGTVETSELTVSKDEWSLMVDEKVDKYEHSKGEFILIVFLIIGLPIIMIGLAIWYIISKKKKK